MVTGQKPPIGVAAPNPGFAPEIEGAPVSTPGRNDGKTTTPATTANDVEADGPMASTDTEAPAPVSLSPEEQAKADAVKGFDRNIKTIQDWMDAEGNRPETPEERKKRERKEKSKKIIAAVSDGISALSNLFFTSQYAPNMYNHEKGSMMKPVNDRIERMKAEREKNADKYLQFSLKLGDLENDRAKTLRELEAQQERQTLAREKAQREVDQHRWFALLQADKQREQKGKADKAEQEAVTAKAVADYAPELQQAKIATEKARKGSLDASTSNSYASAAAHNRSNPKEFTAWDEYGNPYSFKSEKAAIAFAKQHGTWIEEDVVETTKSESETNGKTSSTKTKKGGHAGKPDPTDMDDPTA